MTVLVVGSVALDSVETPFGRADELHAVEHCDRPVREIDDDRQGTECAERSAGVTAERGKVVRH